MLCTKIIEIVHSYALFFESCVPQIKFLLFLSNYWFMDNNYWFMVNNYWFMVNNYWLLVNKGLKKKHDLLKQIIFTP